jgi:hypothetical protein
LMLEELSFDLVSRCKPLESPGGIPNCTNRLSLFNPRFSCHRSPLLFSLFLFLHHASKVDNQENETVPITFEIGSSPFFRDRTEDLAGKKGRISPPTSTSFFDSSSSLRDSDASMVRAL